MTNEPVLTVIGAVTVVLNTALVALLSFVTVTADQAAAIFGLGNAVGLLLAALFVRSKVTPT